MDLPEPSPEAVAALAPTGVLRAAINLSNFLLVVGADAAGQPVGPSPDMALALGRRLGVEVALCRYDSPAAVADDGRSGVWDIGNIGAEPQRAETIDFTPPYAEIEATYLVEEDSPLAAIGDVDRPGNTVACKARSAYGLWLERNLDAAELHQLPDHADVWSSWNRDGGIVGALRPWLLDRVAEGGRPGRILDGSFTAVRQAIGTPKGRAPAGIDYLRRFVRAAIDSGIVEESIRRHGVVGRLSVATST
jgi:polar amino acid transport system substrate-binding protein